MALLAASLSAFLLCTGSLPLDALRTYRRGGSHRAGDFAAEAGSSFNSSEVAVVMPSLPCKSMLSADIAEEMREHPEHMYTFVDVRSPKNVATGKLDLREYSNAFWVNVPWESKERFVADMLGRFRSECTRGPTAECRLIMQCGSGGASRDAALALMEEGHWKGEVIEMCDGIDGWSKNGFPVRDARNDDQSSAFEKLLRQAKAFAMLVMKKLKLTSEA